MSFNKLPFLKKTPEERLRKNQSTLRDVQHALGRDQNALKSQESREIATIKERKKRGQMDEVNRTSKDLEITRRSLTNVILMRENIQALKPKVETLELNDALAKVMKELRSKKVLDTSRELRFIRIQKILMEFGGKDTMGDEDEDDSFRDAKVSQALAELGQNELSGLPSTGQSLGVANKAKASQAAAVGRGGLPSDAELEARLENLRRQ